MDYRELLVKYMAHIGEQEGIYFLGYLGKGFSEEEKAELQKLSKEADEWPQTY
jgi:hypothetical protein